MANWSEYELPRDYRERWNRRDIQPARPIAGANHSPGTLRWIRLGYGRGYSRDSHTKHFSHHSLGCKSEEEAARGYRAEGCTELPGVVEESSDFSCCNDARKSRALQSPDIKEDSNPWQTLKTDSERRLVVREPLG